MLNLPRAPARIAAAAVCLAAGTLACAFTRPDDVGAPQAAVVTVWAERGWNDSGLDLRPGDVLTVAYVSGEWSPWPGQAYDALGSGGDPRCDCNVLAGASHAALLGRIGDGAPFLLGVDFSGPVGAAGRLYLGINDTRLDDNRGSLRVRVAVGR